MKYHVLIEEDDHKTHLSADTSAKLAEAVAKEVERWVDVQLTMPGSVRGPITITPFSRTDCYEVNEQTGEWESPLPKKRGE